MNDCEIISNMACGKHFWVCRTHKVEVPEASFCPAAAKPEPGVTYKTPWAKLADYQVEINRVAEAVKRREFKVGDKVRRIRENWAGMSPGHMGTVIEILDHGGLVIKEFCPVKSCNHDPENFEVV